jgi:hypothetical protein
VSSYESFDWGEWFDDEAMSTESLDVDLYLRELGELAVEGDYGGVEDGFGHISSDADPGL